MNQEQLNELLQKSLRGETTPVEETLLLEWSNKMDEVVSDECAAFTQRHPDQAWIRAWEISVNKAKEITWERWLQKKARNV